MTDKTKFLSVLYDDHGLSNDIGGVSRYYVELWKHFPEQVRWQIAVRYTQNQHLQNEPFNIPPMRREYTVSDFVSRVLKGHYIKGVDRLFWLLRNLVPNLVHADDILNKRLRHSMVKRKDIDLVHLTEPHFFATDWHRDVGEKPFVVTVVDLIPELLCGRDIRIRRKAILEAASGIIAISQYTKERIIENYDIPDHKIRVIYLGPDFDCPLPNPPSLIHKRYILYVGRRRDHHDYKNFPFFIRAIAPLLHTRKDLFLVCTGKPFEDYDNRLFQETGIADKTIHFFARDDQMPSLFAHAEAFIYPSKMEGFGIPILDAFNARCPVVLSHCSCFPEIAGNAALYFEDGDAEGLRTAITTILDNASVRNDLIEQGSARVKSFSWEKCAIETCGFYKEILQRAAHPPLSH